MSVISGAQSPQVTELQRGRDLRRKSFFRGVDFPGYSCTLFASYENSCVAQW